MPSSEHLSDDYVAQLLAKDAKTSNAKYSAYGLQDLLPRRSTFSAPKPNTRFLKNIIRETDNHNAALRAKEVEESRARLRNLRDSDEPLSTSKGSKGARSREAHHRSKRRRTDGEDQEKRDLRRGSEGRLSGRDRDEHREEHYNSEDNDEERYHERRHRHHHRSHRRRDEVDSFKHGRRSTRNRGQSRSRHRSRSRSPRSDVKYHQRHRRSHRPARSSSSATPDSKGHHSPASSVIGHQTLRNPSTNGDANARKRATSPGSDSDPLNAIIGPPPPIPAPKVQARGRGNFSSSSAMDSHFSTNYDPSVDVHPDPEMDDDWDQALEAIRDRQRWQKLGAERLKSAGFTEEEVKKWETGGEKREEDVKWKGRGEGREWDRGKVVGDDGVETRPEWGRLKGT
ncbi:hypothetical protein IMSHALPRED_007608 [Imshaugia aleurites]|uniref:Pre-mRNA-splicing factor 38B n=1 Tax=Imshaugia aleurites TaxID=172621 RepID=A0A8H3ERV0_9LECA|nr:hypothetical protein IMSHALPRED_007608 [Imshaugia aleurites]